VLDLVIFQSSQGKAWKDADELGRLVDGLRGLDLIVTWGEPLPGTHPYYYRSFWSAGDE
jgi:hypothetical protein